MDITSALTQLNLSDREAKIYASLLELGQATPLVLSKKTGLKRPTVYLDLESLRRKKLTGLAFQGRKTVYVPESPNALVANLREQQQTLAQILPMLRALQNTSGQKPTIRFYDRTEDIRNVYYQEIFQATENSYLTNFTELSQQFPGLFEKFHQHMQAGFIQRTREIVMRTPGDLAYASQNHHHNYQVRIIPPGFAFDVDLSLWEQNVGLYSVTNRTLLVISDTAIAKAIHGLFEMAWKASSLPKK